MSYKATFLSHSSNLVANMLNLPVYAREDVYYFHTRVGRKQIKRSSAATNKVRAIIKASKIMEALKKLTCQITELIR